MAGMAGRSLMRTVTAAYGMRRSVATALAIVVAVAFGYHAVFGQNGITAYAKKRSEDRALASQIRALDAENARLRDRVDHLQTDPDTVEMEARQRLHYARTGEVIYTLNRPTDPDAAPANSTGK